MTTCTFDLASPRRPTEADVGGCAKEDEVGFEPNPVTDPTADDWNQISKLVQRLGASSPHTRINVHFAAGVPVVAYVISLKSSVTIATFTVVDNGVGDVSITWPAGTFPSVVLPPEAVPVGATAGTATCESIANGIRVRCTNLANPPAAADIDFNARIY